VSRGLPDHLRRRPRGTNGKLSCRYCHGDIPLTSRRTSYCSDECQHEFRILNEAEYAKACVLVRDEGRCAGCGEQTVPTFPPGWRTPGQFFPVSVRHRARLLARFECDHVLEVARGGTSVLTNLQTLCSPCHAKKTKRFAAERAAERRARSFLFPALPLL
jgi:5-methylcytosine-specific restriction enzyme A